MRMRPSRYWPRRRWGRFDFANFTNFIEAGTIFVKLVALLRSEIPYGEKEPVAVGYATFRGL